MTRPTSDPRLLPFTPLIYLAWADGSLTRDEMIALRQRLAVDDRLDRRTRETVSRWLDPESPPSASELAGLLEGIRRHARDIPEPSRRSLAALGRELVRIGEREEGGPVTAQEAGEAPAAGAVSEALEEVGRSLGVSHDEAARALIPEEAAAPEPSGPPALPAFDPAEVQRWLDPDHPELRARVLEILERPELELVQDEDKAAQRARVHRWCAALAREGLGGLAYPESFGGTGDLTQAVAVFETLAYHDLSLLVKFGVQFGLFGGSVYQLGTRAHHERWLPAIASLELPGCFAMTETAHGSNVRDIETTATWDGATREFVIHTPHEMAGKDYIGNAAVYGRMATVFAQLEVSGERYGVHAFLVPIRDASGRPAPGVRIADRGLKGGLNGVDNGRIWFDRVRVPRGNLLNRFGDVSEEGVYTSPIASPGRRFFTMLGTLVGGRVSVAAASVNAAKLGLAVAVRYTDRRRQFGPEGRGEVPVLDYLTMQRRLLPRLAATYAMDLAMNELVRTYGALDAGSDAREVEALAAALKAYASQHAVETLQECRQACGGEGYMASSRITTHLADADIFTTFEGANTVLLQLVAKGLLTEYREQFGELRLWSAVRYLTGRAAARLADLDPIGPRRTDPDHLRDPDFHAAAFRYREDRLVVSLARRLKRRIDDGEDSFTALNACQDHAVAAGLAYAERVTLEAMQRALPQAGDPARPTLERVAALYALSRIEADLGWFLEKGYVEGAKAAAIRAEVNALCGELRPVAVALADAFGIPEGLLPEVARGGAGS